jgi:hypothetical protein
VRQRNERSRTRNVASVDNGERRFLIAGCGARSADGTMNLSRRLDLDVVDEVSDAILLMMMKSRRARRSRSHRPYGRRQLTRFDPVMPMLKDFRSLECMWDPANLTAVDKQQGAHEFYPGSRPLGG